MDIGQAVLLGIVEGVTEFLPVSSTGHLILTSHIIGLEQTAFVFSFEIAIQLGAILAVVLLYYKQLFLNVPMIKRLAVSFVPTAVLGLIFYKIIKHILFDNTQIIVGALFLGGVIMILIEKSYKGKTGHIADLSSLSYKKAFLIGCIQSLAMIPGVSRAGATIMGGLLLGLERKAIVEYSFLLAVPTMAAATGLDLIKNAGEFSSAQFTILSAGFVSSFIVALLSIKLLLRYIKANDFIAFGYYRMVAAVLFLWWM